MKKVRSVQDKRKQRQDQLRRDAWGDIPPDQLWHRSKNAGFTTVPRTLPLLMTVMDELAGKGKPVSRTYLTLWCRVFESHVVQISDEKTAALESGFSGERRATAWRDRMRRLEQLGFIKSRRGVDGEFSLVLLLNPHWVIRQLWTNRGTAGGVRISEEHFRALEDLAHKVGAEDFFQSSERVVELPAIK